MGGCRVGAVYFGSGSVSTGKRDARQSQGASASPRVTTGDSDRSIVTLMGK